MSQTEKTRTFRGGAVRMFLDKVDGMPYERLASMVNSPLLPALVEHFKTATVPSWDAEAFKASLIDKGEVNFFRVLEDIGTIRVPALPRPTLEELKGEFSWIDKVEIDTSPTEEVTLELGTLLRPNGEMIEGKEYERRRESITGLLGFQQARWLVGHQDEFPPLMALLALLGKVYIDFPGIVVCRSNGSLNFPRLIQDGERWYLGWYWAGFELRSCGRVARARPISSD